MSRHERGLTLVELAIAMTLLLVITASIVAAVRAGWHGFSRAPEAADMQQRLRVAAQSISRDLLVAGAGPSAGGRAASLVDAFPAVLPFRQGAVADDPPGTVRADTLTVISALATAAQTRLRADLPPGSQTLQVAPRTNCAPAINLCGFAAGMTLVVYDQAGSFGTLTATAISDGSSEIAIAPRPQDTAPTTYATGSRVVEAQLHTYYLKTDPATGISQLMSYDGSPNGAVPVVDHVVGLRFEYAGDASPPAVTAAGASYGPAPPPVGVRTSAYPPGESCLFVADADTGLRAARLPTLGGSPHALVTLTPAQLVDGPWCPDDSNANRWDADLLRVRMITVTVRVQAALAALRGPAGALFVNGGTSAGGGMWAPDIEVRFAVTPRNLGVSR